jgi:hypothetical protein
MPGISLDRQAESGHLAAFIKRGRVVGKNVPLAARAAASIPGRLDEITRGGDFEEESDADGNFREA